jgi:FixJ family two-component response regulator
MKERDATVCIVDDASVRRDLGRLLRSAGYRVVTFASAREFLECRDLDGLGCLILDVRMPGESGLDLHQVLVAQGRTIPVIGGVPERQRHLCVCGLRPPREAPLR